MGLAADGHSGFALGAWGAVQATATGLATLFGGTLRDLFGSVAGHLALGAAANSPAAGYDFGYMLEIVLLVAALPAILPLALKPMTGGLKPGRIGLDQMP
jgi:MFS transporter, BCD family, chlorophyll transporter